MKTFLRLAATAMVGMLTGSAFAADMGLKAPPLPTPLWSWTGVYIGVQGGAGWGTTENTSTALQLCPDGGVCGPLTPVTPPGTLIDSYTINGWHGGGTIGVNWQMGLVVIGAEGDVSKSNIKGTGACNGVPIAGFLGGGPSTTCRTELTWFGTVTGRLGFAFDRALLYVKGGGAWGQFDRDVLTGSGGIPFPTPTVRQNRKGFTFGVGIEYAWNNWSAKLEYDFMDFGTEAIVFSTRDPIFLPGTVNSFLDDREQVHVVRAGLNYRFMWGM